MSSIPIRRSNPLQDAYPTIFDLRATHTSLLTKQRQGASVGDIAGDVRDFVRRAQLTGALLDVDEQRDAAQGLIDYWVTTLYRASVEIGDDATLVDFDASLAPTLDDALCPYVGLNSFREDDSKRFFGRKGMVDLALENIRAHRFLAVVGPSGSGKSSVVLGGVLPALRGGALEGSASWRYLPPIVPGAEPLKNLRAAMGDRKPTAGETLVVTIDQFEELFTLCEDLGVRESFTKELAALTKQGHVVIATMRSDYDSRLSTTGELQALFEKGDLRATPLTAAELREAIEEPAKLIGLKFESGVVDALIRDVLGEPAALPLLQFTLWKLWQSRDHNRITLAAYRRLGGGRAALANSATALYEGMIQQDRDTMRRILLRMVRPALGAEVTSSRVRMRELLQLGDDPTRVQRVVDKLVAERLVRITGEEQVEVAHEALIRNWPLLVNWLEHMRAEMIELRRFESLAEEWERFGRESGFLDEEQLKDAERWLASDEAKDLVIRESLPELVAASRKRVKRMKRLRRFAMVGAFVLMAFIIVQQVRTLRAAKRHSTELAAASKLAVDNAYVARDVAMNAGVQLKAALAREQEAKAALERKLQELESAKEVAAPFLGVYGVEEQAQAPVPAPASPLDARPVAIPRENSAWIRTRPMAVPVPAAAQVLTMQRAAPGARVRPVTPGASIGAEEATGSACCVVEANGIRYLLTLPFVIGGQTGARVLQPGAGDGGTMQDTIGIVERVGQDSYRSGALVRLEKGVEVSTTVPHIGALAGIQSRVRRGETVRLVGRGSGLATGSVLEVRRDGQIVTTIIPKDGDAGGPVVNANNELIGLLVASDNRKISLVAPIAPLLKELGVKLVR